MKTQNAKIKGAPTSTTIADVARTAGVAPMTVSRYLNHHPSVTEKTAKKVRTAVEKLGYMPNYAARMLMGRPSNVIGLVLPNLDDTFFAKVAQGVQEIARAKGVFVWIATSDSDASTEAMLIRQMTQHKVDGLLLIPTPSKQVENLKRDSRPVVTIDRPLFGKGIDAVVVENRRGSREAVEHLISHSLQRIACLGADPDLFTIGERVSGYEDAMRAHKLAPSLHLDCTDLPKTRATLKVLLSERLAVQAVFTLNNVSTIYALEALDELGISIPDDVALIGFDDFELASIFKPRLTVVQQPAGDLGKKAAQLLFDQIQATGHSSAITLALPASLIVRESCGCNSRGA